MDINNLLMEAIDEELSSLGESCRLAMYAHLKIRFNLKKQEIPHKIEEFTTAIENIFGAGAKILEIRIMENFFKKIGYTHPRFHTHESLEFAQYVDAVKRNTHHLVSNHKILQPVTC